MQTKLFTDSDLDGLGCGLAAKFAFGDHVDVMYCTYRNLNQRVEQFIDNPDNDDVQLYITDLMVNEKVEKKLAKRFEQGHHVQVIDHHVTALHFNNYEWGQIKVEYDDGRKTCAATLFYDYLLSKDQITTMQGLEEFLELVRQYDTWEWEIEDNIKAKHLNDLFWIFGRYPFQTEMLERLKDPKVRFEFSDVEQFLLDTEERKKERYIHAKNRQLVQAFVGDYCVGITHAEQYHSELGNELNKRNPHLDLIAIMNAGTKKMGFRTIYDHVDVSEFAQRFGGGGHPKASGCEISEETFKLFISDVFDILPIKPDPERNTLNVKGVSYGTSYENEQGKVSYILGKSEDWYIIHEGERVDQNFLTFEDAENYLKRNFRSWLRFDDDVLRDMTSALPLSKQEISEKFQEIMNHFIHKNQA